VLLTSLSGVDDIVKIVDFGVSKFLMDSPEDSALTRDGDIVGTPRYMSPEQGMGIRELDGRSDVYSLGIILYEMLTGRAPYAGNSAFEVIHLKVTRDPVPPSIACPSVYVPRPIEDLVLRALMADPDRRFQSMAELDGAIRATLVQLAPDAARLVRPIAPPREPIEDARPRHARTVFLRATHAPRVTQPLAAAKAPVPPQLPATLPSPIPAPYAWVESSRTALGRSSRRRGSRILLASLAMVTIGVLGALGAAAGLELFGSGRFDDRAHVAPPPAREAARPVPQPLAVTAPPAAEPPGPEAAVEPSVEPSVDPAPAGREPRRRRRTRRSSEKQPHQTEAAKEPTSSPKTTRAWGEPIAPYGP
jgi:serine/threonine-protein kinase